MARWDPWCMYLLYVIRSRSTVTAIWKRKFSKWAFIIKLCERSLPGNRDDPCVDRPSQVRPLCHIGAASSAIVLLFSPYYPPVFWFVMSVTSSIYNQQHVGAGPTLQQPSIHEYLNELVSKRVATLKYLRKAHEGNTHWFNTILLSKNDLANLYPNSRMQRRQDHRIEQTKQGRRILIHRCRTCNFYTLGISLGALLDITNAPDYVKALTQLLSEFEYYTNDSSRQKMVCCLVLCWCNQLNEILLTWIPRKIYSEKLEGRMSRTGQMQEITLIWLYLTL